MTTATASPDKSAAAGRDNALLAALRAELGRDAVLSGADVPPRNDNDHSSLPPARPGIVLRPSDTAGVAAAMRLCRENGQAVVPQGGLTGLCGGARAIDGAVALSLERLTGIDEIDPSSSTITVRAGTPLRGRAAGGATPRASSSRSISARAAPARSAATCRPTPAAIA